MAPLMSQHPGKLLLFVSLSAADLWLTERLLAHGDGWFYESNPIANAWLHTYGWTGLVIFKATSMAVIMGLCLFISRSSPRASGRVLVFACSRLAVVVVYSWSLSWLIPHGSTANGQRTLAAIRARYRAATVQAAKSIDINGAQTRTTLRAAQRGV